MHARIRAAVAALAVAGAGALGCGSDAAALPSAFAVYELPGSGLPSPAQVPFPSDIWRDGEGLRFETTFLSPDAARADLILESLGELDGFASSTAVYFPVQGNLDASFIDGGDAVVIVDLETGERVPVTSFLRKERGVLGAALLRGELLEEGRTYAAVLTDAVRASDGTPLAPSETFRGLRDGGPASGVLGARAHAQVALALHHAASAGVDRSRIVSASLFTTGRPVAFLDRLVAALDAAAPPVVLPGSSFAHVGREALDAYLGAPLEHLPGVGAAPDPDASPPGSTGSLAHDAIYAAFGGSFDAPDYISPNGKDPGRFVLGAGGLPSEKRRAAVPFLCALPRCGDGSTPCSSFEDVPLVLYQHGTTLTRAEVFAVADTLAHAGMATCGIDWPFHGSRLSAIDETSQLTGAPTADGIGDTGPIEPLLRMYNVQGSQEIPAFDLRGWRDAMRQGAVDVTLTTRLLLEGDLGPLREALGLPELAFRQGTAGYIGESLGSMIGAIAGAVDRRLGAVVLSAGGGGLLTELAPNTPSFGEVLVFALGSLYDVGQDEIDPLSQPASTHPSVQMLQTIIDPGDPLVFGRELGRRKHALLLEAYGDELMPNQATEALAVATGAQLLDYHPSLPGFRFAPSIARTAAPARANIEGRTVIAAQMHPATHGVITRRRGERKLKPDYPPIEPLSPAESVDNPTASLQAAVAHFFSGYFGVGELSGAARGAPEVVDPVNAKPPAALP